MERPEGAPRLWGNLRIQVIPDSLASSIYQKSEVEEPFNCNYELNPAYRGQMESSGLLVSGTTEDGGARIIELPFRPFFLATGFMPQFKSEDGEPHPLIVAYLQAAADAR